jgi:predicted ester cyclase
MSAALKTPPNLGAYASVPDFIYGITREIWEDRGIGSKLDRYYAADILLRAPTGLTNSSAGVVAQTLQTLHQFPDRQLVGEDVIWRDEPGGSFLSSHRLISVMRHTGDGVYGLASGRTVRSRIIADCWVMDGQVKEEWLVRDQAAFAHCMGLSPSAMARDMVRAEVAQGVPISFFLPENDRPGQCQPQVQDDAAVAAYLQGLRRIWQDKDTSAIRDLYFHGAALHAPDGQARHGHADIDQFVMGYLASFPNAKFSIDNAFVNREPHRAPRLSVRWSLRGEHTGFGHFGAPSGASVYIMAIAHLQLVDGRVDTEWLMTDEVSIWKQIHAHLESQAGA